MKQSQFAQPEGGRGKTRLPLESVFITFDGFRILSLKLQRIAAIHEVKESALNTNPATSFCAAIYVSHPGRLHR